MNLVNRLRSIMSDIDVNVEQTNIDDFADEWELDSLAIKETIHFIGEVFELAHGDDAINRDFSIEETLETLKEYAENSWKYEELK